MLRKLLLLALGAAVIGAIVFWIVTIPATVPASALASHTPNPANGKEMFYAGGCASCHATPGQDDRTRLGGGLGLKSPFGTFYVPEHLARPERRHRQMERSGFRHRDAEGHLAGRPPLLPGVSRIRPISACVSRTCATCSPTSRRCRRCRARCAITTCRSRSMCGARSAAGSSCSSTASRSSPTRPSRAQWNRGAYLVNGPGHCAECHSPRNLLGGIVETQRFAGGPNPEGEGWVPEHHAKGTRRIFRQGHRLPARDRRIRRRAIRSAAR